MELDLCKCVSAFFVAHIVINTEELSVDLLVFIFIFFLLPNKTSSISHLQCESAQRTDVLPEMMLCGLLSESLTEIVCRCWLMRSLYGASVLKQTHTKIQKRYRNVRVFDVSSLQAIKPLWRSTTTSQNTFIMIFVEYTQYCAARIPSHQSATATEFIERRIK